VNPDRLAILLGTIRAVILNKSAAPAVLPAYDAASEQLIQGFNAAGFDAEDLMALERSLALLREALAELSRRQEQSS
jgi:hypothetical protein